MPTVGDILARLRPDRGVIAAVMSDTHANHKLGLLNPETVLYDENEDGELEAWTPKPGPAQRAIWPWYVEDRDAVVALADGRPIILIHDADVCQGGNGYPRELVSTRLADQFVIAVANFAPWLELPNLERIVLVKGTGYHEFGEGSAAMTVAETLRASGFHVEVPYHIKATIAGAVFDLAHHGPPPGVRNWLKGNLLRLYTQNIMDDCLKDGEDPPAVVLRGHYHQYVPETVTRRARGKTWRTQAAILPSYCLIDDYARKVAKSPDKATIGMLAFEVKDGEVGYPHEFIRVIDFTTKEVLYG